MAHFAEIDSNNIVLRVVVVDNKNTSSADGVEKEYIGASYLESLLGGTWVQTSYNGTIRKNYAGIGYTFDKTRDAFIPVKPFNSWVLNEDTCQWQAPIPYPNDGNKYVWDESTQSWILSPGGI